MLGAASSCSNLRHDVELLVDALVQSHHQLGHWHLEHLANPQQGRDRNWPSRFDLLPVPGGEPKRQHVLLTVAMLLAKRAHLGTQSAEKLFLIRGTQVCKVFMCISLLANWCTCPLGKSALLLFAFTKR